MTEERAFDILADPNYFGTMLVQEGVVDGMVSGAAHTTGDTIRPAFEIIRAREGTSVVSSVFFMCLPDRVLVYGDCAVNPKPDPQQLADIAISSAETAAQFGVEPRIAMLSYSTGESAAGPDVDAVREATEIVRERRPDLVVEGPIQYDAAVDAGVAALKLPGSRVAGPGDGARLPGPRYGQRRLQGGAALVGRRGDRPGAAGPAQARQRPEPRLHRHRHRQHGRDHRDPGAGVRRSPRRPSDQARSRCGARAGRRQAGRRSGFFGSYRPHRLAGARARRADRLAVRVDVGRDHVPRAGRVPPARRARRAHPDAQLLVGALQYRQRPLPRAARRPRGAGTRSSERETSAFGLHGPTLRQAACAPIAVALPPVATPCDSPLR